MNRIAIGLVGVGKIARDQHVPALEESASFRLVATASLAGSVAGIEAYGSFEEMMEARPDIEAVTICTPPQGRYEIALAALKLGKHVMLEKPPAATVGEATTLAAAAEESVRSLFATWHSRESVAVDRACEWLAGKDILSARILWKEDIRQWHPGQEWILDAGGFGVFDPGINALSIITRLLDLPLHVSSAKLSIPINRDSPIHATIAMKSGSARVDAEMDFLHAGDPVWSIEVDTREGTLHLTDGGNCLQLPGENVVRNTNEEYARLYGRFADLVRSGKSDMDLHPLKLVSEISLIAERVPAPPFDF